MMNQLPFRLWSDRQRLARFLRSCSKNGLIDQGIQVHASVLNSGFGYDMMLNNDLINMYSKCGEVRFAHKVFDKMLERNVVAWTALMCGHMLNGNPKESLHLFAKLGSSDVKPNEFTFSTNLKASASLDSLEIGVQIHCVCVKTGYKMKTEVGNSLVDMYCKCGKLNEAGMVFGSMRDKNLISWNVMIAGYTFAGYGEKALLTFKKMQEEKEIPDEYTMTSLLKACSMIGGIVEGKQIHGFLLTSGFLSSTKATIAGSLVDLYVKCNDLLEARRVYNRIEEKNMISWSSLILGYAQEGNLREAMALFRKLREMNNQVDEFVLSGIIGVFSDFALVEQGRQMQAYAAKIMSGLETSVSNSIMDMYLKCGFIDEAKRCFSEMNTRNVISWTVMITGYGKHGFGKEAVDLFYKISKEDNVEPDDVTYLAVLSSCSHSGLVEEAQEIFCRLLETKRIKPRVEHYACMVDVLGRAGRLEEARNLIKTMPIKPNVGIWQALLSACRVHGNVELGKEVGQILTRLDGDNPVNYVMMSNLFAQAGYWDERERVREVVKRKRIKKEAGMSWVEIDKEVHYFYGGNNSHPLAENINGVLKEMEKRLKEELGFVYGVEHALHDVEDESKEENLRVHSEKLAIGLVLAKEGLDQEGKMIRVFKNLRVCVDCHGFIKGLSKILKMIFLVRDANRFHRFVDGKCSCGDYW